MNDELIENAQEHRLYDETYSIKYNKMKNIFKYMLFINTCICIIGIILYIFRIISIRNVEIMIAYIFFSMGILYIIDGIHGIMYWSDFAKQKNGDAKYIIKYYPNIWEKINPYVEIFWLWKYREFLLGEYIPKNTDPIIDRIRNDRRKVKIYFLPFILMMFFIITVLIITFIKYYEL
ncbi:MAG: hypothetical protein LBI28_08205 [Treponema sp.]|jgi:hypothetical protein|nr:hypothetical protein [Treponema sp.]